jgi:2-polyprenyl-3-methyl-5-hydroxy-6-metoxy-1,4-benzoquinol methylase
LVSNLVNAGDLAAAMRAIARPRWATRRLHVRERNRIMATWGPVRSTSSHWYDVPTVVEHRVRRAAAGTGRDHVDRFVATHLGDRRDLCGLSVGCGTGGKEIRWARTGRFRRLDAFDLSEAAIKAATDAAAAADLSDVTRFFVGDLFELAIDHDQYDVVIFEDALHHLSPLDDALRKTETLLRPRGYVVVHDYVGPNRLQMKRDTVKKANAILAAVPMRYRKQTNHRVKRNVCVPSRLRMILRDPSEAPESSSILRLLAARFDVLEVTMLGGTLISPLLDGIAQNFGEPAGQEILSALLILEDALIDTGELASDYVFATYRRRT